MGSWKIGTGDLADIDLHIHVPAGGVPKDGPSAGAAMLTALVSLLTDRVVDPSAAMTGEITLRGLILPVGGVKEKVLAAHRAGLKTIILPARNRAELEEVPENVRDDLTFVFAEKVEDVISTAIAGRGKRRPRAAAKPKRNAARCSTQAGTSDSPSGNVWAGSSEGDQVYRDSPTSTMDKGAVATTAQVGNRGGGQPVDNLQPFLAVSFIIALQGVYPSRS